MILCTNHPHVIYLSSHQVPYLLYLPLVPRTNLLGPGNHKSIRVVHVAVIGEVSILFMINQHAQAGYPTRPKQLYKSTRLITYVTKKSMSYEVQPSTRLIGYVTQKSMSYEVQPSTRLIGYVTQKSMSYEVQPSTGLIGYVTQKSISYEVQPTTD